jgi:hypothetical protein
MKYETKYKIIRFVEKLLKWNPTSKMPFIVEKTRKIEIIRYRHVYRADELKWMKSHNSLELAIAQHLMFALKDAHAIRIIEEPDFTDKGNVVVTAELNFLMP